MIRPDSSNPYGPRLADSIRFQSDFTELRQRQWRRWWLALVCWLLASFLLVTQSDWIVTYIVVLLLVGVSVTFLLAASRTTDQMTVVNQLYDRGRHRKLQG